MVLIADRIRAGDNAAALALIAAAEAHAPKDEGLALAKLGVLEQIGDGAAVGAQLGPWPRPSRRTSASARR